MKINCPNFVPKVTVFTKFLSRLVRTVAFSFFSRQFFDFAFLLKFCFSNQEVPLGSPPLFLISGFFNGKK